MISNMCVGGVIFLFPHSVWGGHKTYCRQGQQSSLQEISSTESLMKFTLILMNVHLSSFKIHTCMNFISVIALSLPDCL